MATITYTATESSITFLAKGLSSSSNTRRITYTSGAISASTTPTPETVADGVTTVVTGLSEATTYTFSWVWEQHEEGDTWTTVDSGTVTASTLDMTPMTAARSQWEELAGKVKRGTSWFGVCKTSGGILAKTVDCPGFVLKEGVQINILFSNSPLSSAAYTLNVNNTGAFPISREGTSTPVASSWKAGEVVSFVFYNGFWRMIDGGHATTTYYGATLLTDSVSSTSTSTAATPNAVKQAYDAATFVSPTIGTFTMKTGFSKDNALTYLYKFGKLVFWQIHFSAAEQMNSGTTYTIADIPEGFIPAKSGIGWGHTTTSGISFYVSASAEGVIYVIPSANVPTTSSRYVGGVYFIS